MTSPSTLLDATQLVKRLNVQPGQTVGDFGAGGSGYVVYELSQAVGPEGTVILFDVQKTALSAAVTALQVRGVSNVKTVWTDLETYQGASGIQDGQLDGGLITNVLHQSKQPKAILAEVGRMLKSGARLLIVDWLTEQKSQLAPPPEQRVGVDHVAQLAEGVGFGVLEKFSAGTYHWGLVLVKS